MGVQFHLVSKLGWGLSKGYGELKEECGLAYAVL